MIYTVLLHGGTTGTIDSDTISGQSAEAFMGEWVIVKTHDENGNTIEVTGILESILEE